MNMSASHAACAGVPAWAQAYLGVAALLQALWGFLGMLWLATVHTISVAQHREDISRAAALQDFMHMKAWLRTS